MFLAKCKTTARGGIKLGLPHRDVVTREREAQPQLPPFRLSESRQTPGFMQVLRWLASLVKACDHRNLLPSKKMNYAKHSSHGHFVDDVVPYYQTIRLR